uniref:Uncharacterized protein n=1 Tax=Arundo donax TaxID=35708 RepID=A0A0A9EPY2_ARUDO
MRIRSHLPRQSAACRRVAPVCPHPTQRVKAHPVREQASELAGMRRWSALGWGQTARASSSR